MRWSPSVTVAAVIRREDHYLVVEECPDGTPVINQPAGHLEFGETLIDAVRREVLEETGRRFEPAGVVGLYQWTRPGSHHTYLRCCFVGDVGEPLPQQRLDPDIVATHWLTLDAIRGGTLAPRSPLVVRCIEDALRGPVLPTTLLHALA